MNDQTQDTPPVLILSLGQWADHAQYRPEIEKASVVVVRHNTGLFEMVRHRTAPLNSKPVPWREMSLMLWGIAVTEEASIADKIRILISLQRSQISLLKSQIDWINEVDTNSDDKFALETDMALRGEFLANLRLILGEEPEPTQS